MNAELDEYVRRLITERGYSPKTAKHLRDHLRAAVHQSAHGTGRELATDPGGVVSAIRGPERRASRQKRHQAIQEFLTVIEPDLPPGVVDAARKATEQFAGRASPLPHLVDRDLGGSNKRVRVRMPFSWDDGDAMIGSAAEFASPGAIQRDVALATLLCRSGLAPGLISSLQWETALPILESSDEVATYDVETKHGREPISFHREAVVALRSLRVASGEPTYGDVFRQVTRPRAQLSNNHIKWIVGRACNSAALPPIDRRHMRAPFGWWLKQRGWDEYHVAHALGFQRVRDLRRLLLPLEEAAAQSETTEFVYLEAVDEGRVADRHAPGTNMPPMPRVVASSGSDTPV